MALAVRSRTRQSKTPQSLGLRFRAPSPAHLSLQPSDRRGWGSLYDALSCRRLDAESLRGLLAHHPLAGSEVPVYAVDMSVWALQQGLEGCSMQSLVRLRADRCFYPDPSGSPARTGRPRRPGSAFNCKDPNTRLQPAAEFASEDAGYGTVRVRVRSGLHPKIRAHARRGSRIRFVPSLCRSGGAPDVV
jgi:hypothetical protein